jgi:hypothetical protein
MNCPVSRSFDAALAEREPVEIDEHAVAMTTLAMAGGGAKAASASSAR